MQYTHKCLDRCFRQIASKIKPTEPGQLFQEPPELLKAARQVDSIELDLATLTQALNLVGSLPQKEREIIALRASRMCWKKIARELQCHRMTASSRWQRAIGKICSGLNRSNFV